jgi:hypothetical protein
LAVVVPLELAGDIAADAVQLTDLGFRTLNTRTRRERCLLLQLLQKGAAAVLILCDLCGKSKECLQKQIDDKGFDICADCWRPLEEELKEGG